MLTIEPALSVTRLAEVAPGRLVRFNNSIALCIQPSGNPDARVLARYDPRRSIFVYQSDQIPAQVFAYQADLILRPRLDSVFAEGPTGTASTELFLDGRNPLVAVRMLAQQTIRLLNLSSGVLEAAPRLVMLAGFKSWELGVRMPGERFVPILSVTANAHREGADEGPFEPDAV
jgi:hypothetical protein